jgi:hypothetical protein
VSHFFRRLSEHGDKQTTDQELWAARAQAIYDGCHAKQKTLIDSARAGYKYLSVRCPRRAGKSFGMASLALWLGEKLPGARILIISLTLKSTKENYWSGAPGGIFRQNHVYGLNLKFNSTDLTWIHENGSRGRLAGAETIADIERIRGAMAEADIAIVDECKSFAPELLRELIRDVLQPGLMTRDGIMVLGGTPGSIPVGTFFEATAEQARTETEVPRPTCIPVGLEDAPAYKDLSPEERSELWRLHTWNIADNTGAKRQWVRALADKVRNGYSDDHPVWRREYLGEWVTDATDLVYSWAAYKNAGTVTWHPSVNTATGKVELDEAVGPWRMVMGIDLGYVDDSALVLCAYSEQLNELRHVYDFKAAELTLDDFMDEIFQVIEKYGRPDAIVADTAGGGSKILVETLNQRYGLGIEPAKKTDKQDWIELVNSDFASGKIKIIPGTDLAHELAGLQWDLNKDSKLVLARTGRLKEDPQCPNHLCDALLYLYKYSYHFWSKAKSAPQEEGTTEWWAEYEKLQLERALARRREGLKDPYNVWARQRARWTS